MLAMKSKWGKLNRIRLGPSKQKPDKPPWSAVIAWCEENARDHYFHSEAYEVFYFRDFRDAIHFKLRWFDDLSNH